MYIHPGGAVRGGRAARRALAGAGQRRGRRGTPQLRFIHIHQLFRIQCTCFELDSVNIDWWICVISCLVGAIALADALRVWPGEVEGDIIIIIIFIIIDLSLYIYICIYLLLIITSIIILLLGEPEPGHAAAGGRRRGGAEDLAHHRDRPEGRPGHGLRKGGWYLGNPHRAQISQFELFELCLLLKLDNKLLVERFEPTVIISINVPSPPLRTTAWTTRTWTRAAASCWSRPWRFPNSPQNSTRNSLKPSVAGRSSHLDLEIDYLTEVPTSAREWVQYLGRTSRGNQGGPEERVVVSNSCFDRALLSTLCMCRPPRWPRLKPPTLNHKPLPWDLP